MGCVVRASIADYTTCAILKVYMFNRSMYFYNLFMDCANNYGVTDKVFLMLNLFLLFFKFYYLLDNLNILQYLPYID